jgi:TonB family protein
MRIRMRRLRIPGIGLALGLLLIAGPGGAQTRGAVETKHVDPVYPEGLLKTEQQGNVLVIGRIDTQGRVQDALVVSTSNPGLSAPALAAVRQWHFRPAMKDGKPIEIFLNAAVRFRIKNENRGQIPEPILGDLAISPADASGKATAPEGFPILKGKDPNLRAEALLDVPPSKEARTLAARLEILSSKTGKVYPIFQPPIAVPANATEVKFPLVVKIDDAWEDGVWVLRLVIDGKNAGGGQFWLARDPAHFQFVVPRS